MVRHLAGPLGGRREQGGVLRLGGRGPWEGLWHQGECILLKCYNLSLLNIYALSTYYFPKGFMFIFTLFPAHPGWYWCFYLGEVEVEKYQRADHVPESILDTWCR